MNKYFVAALVSAFTEWLLMSYWWKVPTYWPTILWHFLFILIVFALVVFIYDLSNNEPEFSTKPGICLLILLGLIFIIGMFWSPMTASGAFYSMGNVKIAKSPLEVVDTNHIRIIPKEQAVWFGNQVLGNGNYGSFYELSNYELQKYRDHLYWIAPLEFRDWGKWLTAGGVSPGYVMVDAEDPNAEAKLVTDYKMRYTYSAFFNSNLNRRLYYNGYANVDLTEVTFEIDDTGKPYYVVSICRPTVGFSAKQLLGAIIVDPETGDSKMYKVGETPAWADRVFPQELAIDYANWWGGYNNGWINSWFGQKNIQEISRTTQGEADKQTTSQDVFLVYNSLNSHPIWVASMTSPSSADFSMTGYITIDSITGEMIQYPDSGYGNEQTAIHTVEAAPEVAMQKSYHGAEPVFYNLYGAKSWIVPVMSASHIVEMIAIVYAKDTRHVAIGKTKEEALDKYKELLATIKAPSTIPTQYRKIIKLKGRVSRINQMVIGNTPNFYLMLDTVKTKIFVVTPVVGEEILLTNIGDNVLMQFYDTGEGKLQVKTFDNLNLTIAKSEPQIKYEKERAVKSETEKKTLTKQAEELQKKAQDLKAEAQDQ